MPIVLPSKYHLVASGSLIKTSDEHPFDYVKKIQYHCAYMSDVKREKQYDLPDRVSAMIVHCLPDEAPYLTVKQKFSDIYLPNGIPNYDRYKNHAGQWSLTGQYFWRYLERVEKEYCTKSNLPLPHYYFSQAPVPVEVVSEEVTSAGDTSGDEASSSSCQEISNPNPPPTPPIIPISSDSDNGEEEDPMEDERDDDDPDF